MICLLHEQAVTCADVKPNIVVKEVAALDTSGSWKIHEAALMLMVCDSRTQRTFFRTFEFDRRGSNQFGPPLMESDWYNLVVDSSKSYLPKK